MKTSSEMRPSEDVLSLNIVFIASPVKARVNRVKILRVHRVLSHTEGVSKPLIMHQLAFAEEFEGLAYVGVVYHTEQVVVGDACLLLCYYHVFATKLSLAKV